MNFGHYSKTITAAIGAVTTIAGALIAQHLLHGNVEHWATIIVVAGGALASTGGVFAVPNAPKSVPVVGMPLDLLAFAGSQYAVPSREQAATFDPGENDRVHYSTAPHPPAAAPKALGRRAPKNAPALSFAAHLVGGAIPVHPIVDPVPNLSWPMDHNDSAGDCVVAALDHFRQVVETLLTGSYQGWTDAELLALYQTQNPGFKSWADGGGPNDGGMDIQTLLEHLVKTGVILGFAKVDHTNLDEIKAAAYLGLGVITGEVLTRKNMSERIWDYHAGDTVEGGHATVTVGYDPRDEQVSWGDVYSMTDAFMAKRVEEAWFVITRAHVDHPGFRAGFDLGGFAAAFTAITGRPFPVPVAPPAPVPTPTPVPAPGPAADSYQTAMDKIPGLNAKLTKNAPAHAESVPDYAAGILADRFKLPH